MEFISGWRAGIILDKHKESGQVQVGFEMYDEEIELDLDMYQRRSWIHLDNEDEIAMHGSMKEISHNLKQYDKYLQHVDYSKDALDELDNELNEVDETDGNALNELDDAFMEGGNGKSNENVDANLQSEKIGFIKGSVVEQNDTM